MCSGCSNLLWAGWSGDQILVGARFSAHLLRPALWSTQPPVQWTLGLSQGVKQLVRGIDHRPPSSTKVKENRVVPLLRLWAFVACSRVNFTFLPVVDKQCKLVKHVANCVEGFHLSILLFCRINTDMILWQPSAPKPVDLFGGKGQTAVDLASTVLQESLYPAFSMCKSGVQYGMWVYSEQHLECYIITHINNETSCRTWWS
jgi:hypothetical protein